MGQGFGSSIPLSLDCNALGCGEIAHPLGSTWQSRTTQFTGKKTREKQGRPGSHSRGSPSDIRIPQNALFLKFYSTSY